MLPNQVFGDAHTFLHGMEDLVVECPLQQVKCLPLHFFELCVKDSVLVRYIIEDEEIAELLLEQTLQLAHCHVLVLL
jgi:adenosine/AMP kinase